MNAIDKLKAKLSKYPAVSYSADQRSITVHPLSDSGFPVTLTVNDKKYTVFFDDGWHEEFASEEEALNCFVWGLSTQCRLRVYRKGGCRYKWTVEYLEEGIWKEDSTTGLFFSFFWMRPEVCVLQNNIWTG